VNVIITLQQQQKRKLKPAKERKKERRKKEEEESDLGKLCHESIKFVELDGGLPRITPHALPWGATALVLVKIREKLVW
jgi:hypothetical protein